MSTARGLVDVAKAAKSYQNGGERSDVHTLLPDPVFAPIRIPVVSCDDHVVEPPDLFTGRLSRRFADHAPAVVIGDDGLEYWRFEDLLEPNRTAATSIVGRPPDQWTIEPVLFSEMRPASYDPRARLLDMDSAGIAASLCFPSVMFGFAGQRFYRMRDHELGHAAMQAYNDWVIDEWVATDPSRFIAQQVTWLPDPRRAAAEIRRNAARGFRAVAFSESPEALGFPSLHTDHWDPFFEACAETETVINLHVGSSSRIPSPSTDSPPDCGLALFPVNALMASVDWVYSKVLVRFPSLRVALSEGGVSWVPMVLERLRRNARLRDATLTWRGQAETPEEVFRRAFWFCSIEDPSGIGLRHEIGLDRIMLEVDYPHIDSSWPDTQAVVQSEIGAIPLAEKRMIAYANACALYRHPMDAVHRVESADRPTSEPARAVPVGVRHAVPPIPIDSSVTTFFPAGALAVGLELRHLDEAVARRNYSDAELSGRTAPLEEDGGPSLHICRASDGEEILRFDCFDRGPHYHYLGPGSNVSVACDRAAIGDPFSWALDTIATRLRPMLIEAGADTLAAEVDDYAVAGAVDAVRARWHTQLAAPRDA